MLITRAVIELGQFQPRGSGQAGLAHAAFSAELQDPHVCILELWQRLRESGRHPAFADS